MPAAPRKRAFRAEVRLACNGASVTSSFRMKGTAMDRATLLQLLEQARERADWEAVIEIERQLAALDQPKEEKTEEKK